MLKQLDRRTFLRGSGVAMALPLLDAMAPTTHRARAAAAAKPIKRLVCASNPFGMYPPDFFPKDETGADYTMPDLLKPLQKHRNDFTVFSHLDHGMSGGHGATHAFLTGVKSEDAAMAPQGSISMDLKAAQFVGAATRFGSLTLTAGGRSLMSWTRTGVSVPAIDSPSKLFAALFVEDDANEKTRRAAELEINGSVLDAVMNQAKDLQSDLGKADKQKLEEYFTSVRDVETKIQMNRAWLDRPKPQIEGKGPKDGDPIANLPLMYDLTALALRTDSTRVATLSFDPGSKLTELGLAASYHKYSHHGMLPQLVGGLTAIEQFQMQELNRFLDTLKSIEDPIAQGTLFDHTMTLFGSGLANGSNHSTKDMPVLLAGGGFRHGRHLVSPSEDGKRAPLCNLYVSMLQKFGLEIDQFGISNSTLTGLEIA